MNEILRVLSYDEFIADYGRITICDEMHLITEKGVRIFLSKHFEAALNNYLVSLDYSLLKHYYYVLSSEDVYDENGVRLKEKVWYIYIKQYLRLANDNSNFVLTQNIPNYKILRRRNFCKILIQTGTNSFFELYKIDIYKISREGPLYKGNNSYTLKTSKGEFTFTYKTLKFLYALIEILSIDANDRIYILYDNGNYESNTNEPIYKEF